MTDLARAPNIVRTDSLSPMPAAGTSPPAHEFRAIYEREFSYVWNALVRLGVRGENLQDFAHDVFATSYRKLPTYDRSRPIRPWLFGIAYRTVVDARRKQSHGREVGAPLPEVVDPSRSPEAKVAVTQARQIAQRIIDRMDLDRRAVFVMHDLEGHSVPDISEALGVPLNTAYSRLRLARAEFNEQVERAVGKELRS